MSKTKSKRSKVRKNKPKYKIRNWREYNEMLVNRGRIDVWVEKGALETWFAKDPKKRKRGAKKRYSDQAIQLTLQFGQVFHQKLRQTEGLVNSILKCMRIDMDVPDHSTLSRRGEVLPVKLPKENRETVTIIVDASGLKVYGEGEWKVRRHGYSKHRTWRKIHLAVTPDGEIREEKLTGNDVTDGQILPELIERESADIDRLVGDGAYDKFKVYETCQEKRINIIAVPPQRNAKILLHGNRKEMPHPRDKNLRLIRKSSLASWKKGIGYHVRSIGENVYFRWKTIFGDKLNARKVGTQKTEARIKAAILNKMRILGMPDSYAAK